MLSCRSRNTYLLFRPFLHDSLSANQQTAWVVAPPLSCWTVAHECLGLLVNSTVVFIMVDVLFWLSRLLLSVSCPWITRRSTSTWMHCFHLLTTFTWELSELVRFETRVRWHISLPVSFSKVLVYFKQSADDSRFYCADLCCPSNPQFCP